MLWCNSRLIPFESSPNIKDVNRHWEMGNTCDASIDRVSGM